MVRWIKRKLYFSIANYFRFFAQIQLFLWKPRIILVTGSGGKTTLLHLLESQIGEEARYSHHANSAYGIPFDILDLKRKKLTKDEWILLFLLAPLKAFKSPFKEKLYIVEADCDRPGEGKFLATLLKPEVVLLLNVSKSHSMNFDIVVRQGKFQTVDEAIAYEFGYFIEYCSTLAVVNGDSDLIRKQLPRVKAKVEMIIKKDYLQGYQVTSQGTEFRINNQVHNFRFLLPEDVVYALVMCKLVINYLHKSFDPSFVKFTIPPGRSSLFRGIKGTTIVDSSYNAILSSMNVVLDMFEKIPSGNKWVILGDMIEQGNEEQEEHEKLAEILSTMKLERVILMGPRVSKYTYPTLVAAVGDTVVVEKFTTPTESLDYLLKNITGGEILLFKGARFLEGVIEHLLDDKKDVENLCRREKIWDIRRKQWGL